MGVMAREIRQMGSGFFLLFFTPILPTIVIARLTTDFTVKVKFVIFKIQSGNLVFNNLTNFSLTTKFAAGDFWFFSSKENNVYVVIDLVFVLFLQ